MKLYWKVMGSLLPALLSMISYHSVISAQIPGGDPAQLHSQLLDQSLVSWRLKPDSVSGITRELLICSGSCQNDLQTT